MKCLNEFEKKYAKEGYQYILGIDEAGRGPLAGPLVVAGVCFPEGYEHDDIYDSKKTSEKKREALFDIIIKDALYYFIEIIDIEEIDRLNIYQATKQAMAQIAIKEPKIEVVLTDAMPLTIDDKVVESIIKGDQKSVTIAAASILAKVTRDRIMYEYDKQYPQYGFKNNKGYPTKQHLQALEEFGVLEIHRKTYGPVQRLRQLKLDI